MNANHTTRNATRQSVAALAMAATMTLGLLSALGQIADRYHAGEVMAQDAAAAAQAVVAVAASQRG